MGKTQSAGNRGEAAVARYLRQKGYTLLESQWRCRFGGRTDKPSMARCMASIRALRMSISSISHASTRATLQETA